MNSTLVSVIISTYNSSEYVLETLSSVLNQSWKEVELIITDDCSTDTTLELCKEWLYLHEGRFVRTALLSSRINTGVSANANRGLQVARGNWIKFLGADDTLKTDCLSDNMTWLVNHPEIKVLFSKVEVYKDNFNPQNLLRTIPDDPHGKGSIVASERSAASQYKMLLLCDRIHFTPSVFINRETLISVGGFDERYKLLEDYPLWLKLTKGGYKLYYFDNVTVNYRIHENAINNTGKEYLINPNYFKTEDFRKSNTYPYLPADIRFSQRFSWFASRIFRFSFLNRNKKPNQLLLSLLTFYLNPFQCYISLRKHFDNNLKINEFYSS